MISVNNIKDLYKAAEENGLSFDRLKVLEWGAEECDIWDNRKMKKSNPDTGFASKTQILNRF